eukprot:Gb_18690 [translate_table: standard]
MDVTTFLQPKPTRSSCAWSVDNVHPNKRQSRYLTRSPVCLRYRIEYIIPRSSTRLIRCCQNAHKVEQSESGGSHGKVGSPKSSIVMKSNFFATTFNNIGIVDFLEDKNFLVTGSTGFLAKVLIEKILRVQPRVGKLFLVIKAMDSEAALQRLKNEVMNSELFKCLRETYGNEYEKFLLRRLIPVVGDVTRDELGIEADVADELVSEVDIIVNSAATTTFDERYDVALNINTRGVSRLMEFARRCHRLRLFLQISTAYVNGERRGRVLEKPFQMGDSIAKENAESTPFLDIQAEFELANKTLNDISNLLNSKSHKVADTEKQRVAQIMKDLGIERARRYGWQDTYVFTKAMGEMLIDNCRGDLPVVIVRPSVIESTYSDPFPGWIEGNRMIDPLIWSYGKGQLTGFLADPNAVIDVVPVDMVVNATLAAMAKHAGATSGLDVYHVASSVVNPLEFGHLFELFFEHFKSFPYVGADRKPFEIEEMKLFGSMDDFCSHLRSIAFDTALHVSNRLSSRDKEMLKRLKSISMRSLAQAKYLANIYEPYTFYQARFDNTNTERLLRELSEEEKLAFGFDVKRIEWKDYIPNIHIPGLRQYVMKGRGGKAE